MTASDGIATFRETLIPRAEAHDGYVERVDKVPCNSVHF